MLLGLYCILYEGLSADGVYSLLKSVEPFLPFRDAAVGPSVFPLTVKAVLKGIERAVQCKFLDFSTFNVEEYEHFEQVENGDLNIVVPGKFLAFAGPRSNTEALNNTGAVNSPLAVKDIIPVFQLYGVSTVVRLNKRIYEKSEFECEGIAHFDLFFPDGSTPSNAIVDKFMEICKKASGCIAVRKS